MSLRRDEIREPSTAGLLETKSPLLLLGASERGSWRVCDRAGLELDIYLMGEESARTSVNWPNKPVPADHTSHGGNIPAGCHISSISRRSHWWAGFLHSDVRRFGTAIISIGRGGLEEHRRRRRHRRLASRTPGRAGSSLKLISILRGRTARHGLLLRTGRTRSGSGRISRRATSPRRGRRHGKTQAGDGRDGGRRRREGQQELRLNLQNASTRHRVKHFLFGTTRRSSTASQPQPSYCPMRLAPSSTPPTPPQPHVLHLLFMAVFGPAMFH